VKLIIRLVMLAFLGGIGYIVYDLKEQDNLSVDSFQSEVSKHWDTAKEKSTEITAVTKEHYNNLKGKWKEQYSKLDWEDIKSHLKISDQDLAEYKEFMQWAHSEEEVEEPEGITKDVNNLSEKSSNEKPSVSLKQKVPDKTELTVSEIKKNGLHAKAKELLEEAKSLNRKAVPNQAGYKKNLRKSVAAYQLAAEQYEKLIEYPGLSKREKESYNETLSQINQQIYWGKKFDTI